MSVSTRTPLLRIASAGLFCEAGGFYIDPWGPVARAVITHAHGDHAIKGHAEYLCATSGAGVLKYRMGPHARIRTLEYGETLRVGPVQISLHQAGHILGSAQVRLELNGEVWVVTGDYKRTPDRTCEPFELVRCQTLITESTFGLPEFKWPDPVLVEEDLCRWWEGNRRAGLASFVYAYALGKAQRVLSALPEGEGVICCHVDVTALTDFYRQAGVVFPAVVERVKPEDWPQALCLLPPSARFRQPFPIYGPYATAFVSGWMLQPGSPEEYRVQVGFALSDHADHAELLQTVRESGAERVLVTHGQIDSFVAELRGLGVDAHPLRTPRCGKE